MIQSDLEPQRENPKQIHATTPPPTEACIDTQVVGNGLLIGINRPAKPYLKFRPQKAEFLLSNSRK